MEMWKWCRKACLIAAACATAALAFGGSTDLAAERAKAPVAQATESVTFSKDIAPILQRSCQNCHRPAGVAPMSLVTYEEVRPWARAIKLRTSIGPKAGVMPPWYVEKNIGIQHYKNDPSLSTAELAKIATWVDNGAPRGDASNMPAPPTTPTIDDDSVWTIGKPDLIVSTKDIIVKANAPDWWGEIESLPTGLTEDRYVESIEIKEVNDVPRDGSGRSTVGGRYVFHHMIYRTEVRDGADTDDPASQEATSWPVHEVGRNADLFDPDASPILRAGSYVVSDSVHLHSNGRDTKARLDIGFKFRPKGYTPKYRRARVALGNGMDIDIKPMEANQQLHAYAVLQEHTKIVTFEPHLHAPGARMCLEAIWGMNIQTLTCAGYDHNWVRGYAYDNDHAPLLPKGTILHIIGYMDNSPANKNVPDPRNWQGSGNRSVANMFIDLGMRVALTDEQFEEEMNKRRARMRQTQTDVVVGCPLCNVKTWRDPKKTTSQQQQEW
jgi:mono/diheme cytochrome c family protein